MPLPVQVSVYTTLLGTEEGINPVALPELFSSGGSLNMYIDELGRAKKILGYTVLNSATVTANGSGDPVINRSLHVYNTISTPLLVAVWDDQVNEGEIWTSDDQGISWTFRAQWGTGGVLPSAAQYGTAMYLALATNTPYKTTNGTTWTAVSPTQSPTPSAADSASGQALNGTYKYKLVSMEGALRHAGSTASSAVQVQNEAVAVTWTADADTNVTGYELYRTTGTGSVYYFVTFIEGRTTAAYTDNTPDRIILENRVLTNHGDAPPASYHVVVHKDRLWWLRQSATPSRGYFSDVGLPESVGTNNFLEFSESDGRQDYLTGGVSYDGRLIVGSRAGLWSVSGTGAVIGGIVDFRKNKTNAQAGWVHTNTVVQVPEGAIYRDERGQVHQTDKVTLAYLTDHGDIRLFDGDNDTVISNSMKETLSTFNRKWCDFSRAAHDPERGHIMWFPTFNNHEGLQRAVVWNYRFGVWYEWQLDGFIGSAIHMSSAGDFPDVVLFGGLTRPGKVLRFWLGNGFFNTAIPAQWMSGTIYGRLGEDTVGREVSLPALPFTKRWRWVDPILQTTAGITLTLEWFAGQAGDDATAIGSVTLNPDDFLNESTQKRLQLKDPSGQFLHDEGIRLRVSESSTAGSWALEGFSLGFQVLPGLKRRSQ